MTLNLPFRQKHLELCSSELWFMFTDQGGRDSPSSEVCFQYTDYCCRCSVVQSVDFPPSAKVVDRQQVVVAAPKEHVSSGFRPGKDGFNRHELSFCCAVARVWHASQSSASCLISDAIPGQTTHSCARRTILTAPR